MKSGFTTAKLLDPFYYSAIAALNRSNPFGLELVAEPPWPDSWSATLLRPFQLLNTLRLAPEMVHSPLVVDTTRDIYHLAIVALEMIGSLDVTRAYPLASAALSSSLLPTVP